MKIIEEFFWFRKEKKRMEKMYKMNNKKKLGTWKYESNYGAYFKPMSLKEFLANRILVNGFYDIFWDLQPRNRTITENLRYKKARSKWNAFAKNNIKFSDDFIKIGDTVEARNSLGVLYGGTVIGFPKTFSGVFKIKKSNGEEHTVSILWCSIIKVKGVERKPEFYIKRKRKIYGANKR